MFIITISRTFGGLKKDSRLRNAMIRIVRFVGMIIVFVRGVRIVKGSSLMERVVLVLRVVLVVWMGSMLMRLFIVGVAMKFVRSFFF